MPLATHPKLRERGSNSFRHKIKKMADSEDAPTLCRSRLVTLGLFMNSAKGPKEGKVCEIIEDCVTRHRSEFFFDFIMKCCHYFR